MKILHGLEKIAQKPLNTLKPANLATLLLADLQDCVCYIYGDDGANPKTLLAALRLLPDTLNYLPLEQRLELIVAGPILRNDCVPLTYCLQGKEFSVTGRCSMIAKVCGVDLYLQSSYTGRIGDVARQRFAFDLKNIIKS